MLSEALMGLTCTEGAKEENKWAFTVKAKNKEFKELIELVNSEKLEFNPENVFKSVKRSLYYNEMNIRQAITAFVGQSAMADILFSQKQRDTEFVRKVILGPLKAQMDMIKSLIVAFRYKALPVKLKAETS